MPHPERANCFNSGKDGYVTMREYGVRILPCLAVPRAGTSAAQYLHGLLDGSEVTLERFGEGGMGCSRARKVIAVGFMFVLVEFQRA